MPLKHYERHYYCKAGHLAFYRVTDAWGVTLWAPFDAMMPRMTGYGRWN